MTTKEKLAQKLEKMGYPEVGSVKGIQALKASEKSIVSCAISKMSNE